MWKYNYDYSYGYNTECENSDELKHYGKLGMKWKHYKYKTGNKEAGKNGYHKAIEKTKKLENKSAKYDLKAKKETAKAMKPNVGVQIWDYFNPGYEDYYKEKHLAKAAKYSEKSADLSLKAKKWMNSVDETWADVPTSDLNQEDVEYAKKYMEHVMLY